MTIEQGKTNRGIFEGSFSRTGGVVKKSETPFPVDAYIVRELGPKKLADRDEAVRKAEKVFSKIYDGAQFRTPGMRFMAESDTAFLERSLGNPWGKSILDVGTGTGRITLPLAEAVGSTGKVYGIDIAVEYFDVLIPKAAAAGIPPDQLEVAEADMQSLTSDDLSGFTGGNVTDATVFFGTLCLMTTNPERALRNIAATLKPGGSLMLTTNSLDGVAYRVPEQALSEGANETIPLGYEPSIFTRRAFSDPTSNRPDGMILGTGQFLPAAYYNFTELGEMLSSAGLTVVDEQGIGRLTGLFPAIPSIGFELERYIEIVRQLEPAAASEMESVKDNPDKVFEIACRYDNAFAKDAKRINQYTYAAVNAVKKS